MKTYSVDHVQDTLIGLIVTPDRDKFEEELQMDTPNSRKDHNEKTTDIH